MDEKPNAAKPKSRRRWYQYSLRTLLIGVTLTGCGFGWFGAKLRSARLQRLAVERLESCNQTVVYDYETRGPDVLWYREDIRPAAEPPGPAWLRSRLGKDFFATVVEIKLGTFWAQRDVFDLDVWQQFPELKRLGLYGPSFANDQALRQLPELPQVEELCIGASSDEGLQFLKKFPKLRSLVIEQARVSRAAVENIAGLHGLEELSVYYFADSNLKYVARLPNLRLLNLCFCGDAITDAGTSQLILCGKLKTLILDYTKITDAALPALASLPELESLSIAGTRITPDGLKNLKTFRKLRTLGVDRDTLTGLGTARVRELTSLNRLNIVTTFLSDTYGFPEMRKFLDRLQKALPNVTIQVVLR